MTVITLVSDNGVYSSILCCCYMYISTSVPRTLWVVTHTTDPHLCAQVNISNTIVSVSTENFIRISSVLIPPDTATLTMICRQGFSDALSFLQARSSSSPAVDKCLFCDQGQCLIEISDVSE